MRRLAGLLLVMVALLPAAQLEKTRPKVAVLAAAGTAIKGHIDNFGITEPVDMLCSPQGVYLEGYGAVFTAQVDLILTPPITPFRQSISKEDIAKIHNRKLVRLELFKAQMRQMLAASAAALEGMPANETVVLAISLFHFKWENTAGLPSQIVMQASRENLLKRPVPGDAIQVQEY